MLHLGSNGKGDEMMTSEDLRRFAEMSAQERVFLTVYLTENAPVDDLKDLFDDRRKALSVGEAERDEREHFDENARCVLEYLDRNGPLSSPVCFICCWALDVFEVVPLGAPVENRVSIDSSPFIRPLAEFLDEYENVAVVIADNKKARIFMVTASVATEAETIKGNVKNHVRKGGWSQQRYERRRDKQLLDYSREIVTALTDLEREENFRRIILVGGREILSSVYEELPDRLKACAIDKAADLNRGEHEINADIMELFRERERESEEALWERIRTTYLQGGTAVIGLEPVLGAAKIGRVETALISRDLAADGHRCRDCGNLAPGKRDACARCGSDSVFDVDLINEIVELLTLTSASCDFADPITTLTESGGIAASLRY